MVWGAHYTLGACYLYIKRNVEKVWGARFTSVCVIYWKIWYMSRNISRTQNISIELTTLL
jgi:hypothetical protein